MICPLYQEMKEHDTVMSQLCFSSMHSSKCDLSENTFMELTRQLFSGYEMLFNSDAFL